MRKLIWLLALLMMIACAAQAEEYYCTQTDDLYYHVNANCGGLTDMTTLSAEDAKNSGKFPCPVCVPDDNKWQADIAARTRSRLSFTAASGRPTISNIGIPSTQYASTVTG